MKLSANDLRAIEDFDYDLNEDHNEIRIPRRRNDKNRYDERMKGEDRKAQRRQKDKRQQNDWE